MLAEVAVKAVDLTGRAGKENAPPAVEIVAHLLIAVADLTLHGLRPAQARQLLGAVDGDVPHMELLVRGRAEHDAAGFENIVRERGEYAARGGRAAHGFVRVPRGKDRGLGPRLTLFADGADMAAVPALDAGVRHGGVEKALTVGQHMDRAARTAVGAGAAAGAALLRGQLGGGLLQHSDQPPVKVKWGSERPGQPARISNFSTPSGTGTPARSSPRAPHASRSSRRRSSRPRSRWWGWSG